MLPKQLRFLTPEGLPEGFRGVLNINLPWGFSAYARLDNVVNGFEKNKSRRHFALMLLFLRSISLVNC